MPRVSGWSDDEFERRAFTLAALIRRVWRAIARQVAAQAEQQSTVTMAVARPIVPQWTQAVDAQIVGHVTNMFLDAAGNVSDTLNAPDELLIGDDLVEVFANAARNRLVGIGDDVWKNVQAQITLGNQAGESIPEIAERIRNVAGVSEARSLVIARTEVHAAHEAGSHAQAEFIDPNGEKTWIATEDERTRPSHRRADGQTVKIGESFHVGTATLRYPGDPLGEAGETINCRCTTTYNFDMITTVIDEPEDALVAAASSKWKPAMHPRGNDGKFIKKGSLSNLLSKTKPNIIDVTNAVQDLDDAQWKKLTHAQQQYVKDSIDKLPSGTNIHKNAVKKLSELPNTGSHDTTDKTLSAPDIKSATTDAPVTTSTKIPAGLKGKPGDPAKITTGVVWGKHSPGDVIVQDKSGLQRVKWNGKKYDIESKQSDGTWNVDTSMSKKEFYEKHKGDGSGWVIPGSSKTVDDEPNVTPSKAPNLPQTPPTPASVDTTTPDWTTPQDFSGFSKIGGQAGSNPGGKYNAPDGTEWYVKKPKSANHAANEQAASAFYNLAGIDAPQVMKGSGAPELGGKLQTGTKIVPGAKANLGQKLNDKDYLKEIQSGFAVDAWLANWDVAGMGYDNVVQGADGKPHRIDVGGALLYRAQGEPKGNAFGKTVPELETLRDGTNPQSAKVFGSMTDDDIRKSSARLAAISDDDIDNVVANSGLDKSVAETLKARKNYILEKYPPLKSSDEKTTTSPWAGLSKSEIDKQYNKGLLTATEYEAATGHSPLPPAESHADIKNPGTTNTGALMNLNMGDAEVMTTIDGKYTIELAPNNSYSPYKIVVHNPDGTEKTYGVQKVADVTHVAGDQVWYPKKEMDQAKNDPETLSHISDTKLTYSDIDSGIDVSDYSPNEIIGYTKDGEHRILYNANVGGITYQTKVSSTGDDDLDWATNDIYENEPDIGDGAAEKLYNDNPDLQFYKPNDVTTAGKKDNLLQPGLYNAQSMTTQEKKSYLNDASNDNIMASEAVHLLTAEGGLTKDDFNSLSDDQKNSLYYNLNEANSHNLPGADEALKKWNKYTNDDVAAPTPEPTEHGHTGDVTFDPPGTGTSSAGVVFEMIDYVPANPNKTILVGKDKFDNKYRLSVAEEDGKKVVNVDFWDDKKKSFTPHAQFSDEEEYVTWDVDDIKWDTPSSLPDKSAISENASLPTASVYDLPSPENHLQGMNLSLSQGAKIHQHGFSVGKVLGISGDGKKRIVVSDAEPTSYGPITSYKMQVKTDTGWADDTPLSNLQMIKELKSSNNDYWIPDHVMQVIDPTYKSGSNATQAPSLATSPVATPTVNEITPPTPAVTPSVNPTPSVYKINNLKAAMKSNGNTGYWSKPEKIWDSFKKWQSEPGNENYAPMDVFKALDASLKTSKPNPFQEKMTKWAASAKGSQIVGKDGIFSAPSATKTSSDLPAFTLNNLNAIWAHMQKMNDGDILAVSNEGDMRLKIYTAPDGTKLAHKEELLDNGSWQYYSDAVGSKLKLKYLLKTEDEEPSWAKQGWQAPPPDMQNQPTTPKISSPSVPSTSPSTPNTPSTNALPDVDAGGDISEFSNVQKSAVYNSFKAHSGTFLSSSPDSVYDALTSVAKVEDLTLAQVINIVDEQSAKKANKPNANLFKKKISDWLKTPSGAAYIFNEPPKVTGLPDPPKYLSQYEPDKLLPSFEESSKLTYEPIKSVNEASKIWNDITAKTEPLTSSQQNGLKTWTGGSYTTINTYLFAPGQSELSPTHKSAMKNSQAGMRPVDRPVLLVRGSGFQGIGNAKNHAQLEKLVGTTWRNNAFAATSVGVDSNGVAHPAFSHYPMWIEFECPPGTPMAWLDPFSQHKGEREMLLGADLHYRIVSVEKKNVPGYGMKTITRVRVVPKPEEAAE